MIGLTLQIRPAEAEDRQAVSNLIFFQNHVHRHLDWRPPLDWLGSPYFWLMEENGRVRAALACPPDPPGVAWVRLFAFGGQIPASQAWSALWDLARSEIARRGGAQVAAIARHGWMRSLLEASNFDRLPSVVLLERYGGAVLPPSLPPSVTLRALTEADLPMLAQVDAEAFPPLWRLSLENFQRAFAQALYAAGIESGGRLLAYQLSTGKPGGAHLARLAVRKDAQGAGFGSALLADLIVQLRRRGMRLLTVNTQADNRASLSLYQKFGFVRTGEEFAVFRRHV